MSTEVPDMKKRVEIEWSPFSLLDTDYPLTIPLEWLE